jgi:hypothetical protein
MALRNVSRRSTDHFTDHAACPCRSESREAASRAMVLVGALSNPGLQDLFQSLTSQRRRKHPRRKSQSEGPQPDGRRKFGTVSGAIVRVLAVAQSDLRVRGFGTRSSGSLVSPCPATQSRAICIGAAMVRDRSSNASAAVVTGCVVTRIREKLLSTWSTVPQRFRADLTAPRNEDAGKESARLSSPSPAYRSYRSGSASGCSRTRLRSKPPTDPFYGQQMHKGGKFGIRILQESIKRPLKARPEHRLL